MMRGIIWATMAAARRVGMLAFAFLFLLSSLHAATLSDDPKDRLSTVPHDPVIEEAIVDSGMEMVVVNFEGWRETMASFARLKLHEITGRTSIHGQHPTYSVLSMIYEGEQWNNALIIPVEHPDILPALDLPGKWVSASMVLHNSKLDAFITELKAGRAEGEEVDRLRRLMGAVTQVTKLGREMRVLTMFEDKGIAPNDILDLLDDKEKWNETKRELHEKEAALDARKPYYQAGETLLGRAQALGALPQDFLVVPDTESVDGRWVRPVHVSAAGGQNLFTAGREFDIELQKAFLTKEPEVIAPAVSKFLQLAERSRLYPDQRYRVWKNFYVQNNPWRMASGFYILGAVITGLWFFFDKRPFYIASIALMGLGFVFHTIAILIRAYLTGHVPVSNMFESITFMAWAMVLLAFVFEGFHRRGMVALGAMILGFLLLSGAGMMPLHQTRLHPLRAVLNSYWLNIHVTLMLISYAAFAIAAFFAAVYLIKSMLGREKLFGKSAIMTLPQTEEFAYRIVQVGWPILTIGITLGAVWADTAWGRYWGWDPKETWAFITWVTYTVYLHTRMVFGWRGKWSAAACLLGFVMVMITWWGVSYLPWFSGGLHTYASPN